MGQKIALALAAVLLTLTALEIGWRVYVDRLGTQRQKMLYLYSRDDIDKIESLYRGLPFVNFGLNPEREDINSLGYRGPEIALPKPANIYRIVAMGGSTTYGGYLDTYEQAWPYKLERMLVSRHGFHDVEVVNAGAPSYTSFETAANYLLRAQDLDPDLIIIYHATNDVTPRLVAPEEYSGGYEARGIWRDLDEALPASALQRLLMHKLGDSLKLAFTLDERMWAPRDIGRCQLDVSQAPPACVNLGMTAAQVLKANPPVYFRRNLESIISLARGRGAKVLLLTWAYSPHAYDAPHGDIMIHAFRQAAVAEHNAIIRELASERGVMLYDMASSMPIDREYWYNGVHQSELGTTEMARQLADYLAASGILAQ